MTKRTTLRYIFFLLAAALTVILISCYTVPEPEEIPTDLTQAEYFQRAQEHVDRSEWDAALVYYQTYIDRHPEDRPNVVAARYEIAFIHYKMGNYEESRSRFQDIISLYEQAEEGSLPRWPRILSEKVLVKIEEKLQAQADSEPEEGEEA
ncbi:MAG: tetratricopeptide repeat protein [Spirochaetales bacterium]|nr:tetratricopeptide repeat protein [Spirochaetales bacterium]MCF7939571.1 tetratricopeptide repeat protein [Spirochaetales bacterium]